MKKIFLAIMLALVASPIVRAEEAGEPQQSSQKQEKMRREITDFKVKYIAQEIGLPDDKKREFTALYSEYEEQRSDAMEEAYRLERELRKKDNATEEDYARATQAMAAAREREAQLEKEYSGKFAKILTQKQIFKMREAEEEFRKKVRQMHQDRHKAKQQVQKSPTKTRKQNKK